jgi:hypothetical protein
MFYLPPGSMMQLNDGRVLHKDNKTNQWSDNMGVPITEQQLQFILQMPSFYDDGDLPNRTMYLNADFGDIGVTLASTMTFNDNRTITIGRSLLPQSIIVNFAAGGTYLANAGTTLTAYRNDVGITAIGITNTAPSSLMLGQFNSGDRLKFSMFVPTGNTLDFNATVVGTPGIPPQKELDTFRVFTNF